MSQEFDRLNAILRFAKSVVETYPQHSSDLQQIIKNNPSVGHSSKGYFLNFGNTRVYGHKPNCVDRVEAHVRFYARIIEDAVTIVNTRNDAIAKFKTFTSEQLLILGLTHLVENYDDKKQALIDTLDENQKSYINEFVYACEYDEE